MSREIENIEKLMSEKRAQFRDFSIKSIEKRSDEESGVDIMTVSGVPVVFESETVLFRDGDDDICEIIDSHAFDDADMHDVIFNQNHGGRVFARTRNDSLKLSIEEDGLHMSADLWSDDTGHMELLRDIKRGNLDKMSFAFTIADGGEKWEEDKANHKYIRRITAIDRLFDVSAVDIPAYDATSISARSAFDAERERRAAESLKQEMLDRENEKRKAIAEKIKAMNEGDL